MNRLRQLLEMIRFSHTVFALPFAMLSAVMAWTAVCEYSPQTPFRWYELAGILLCMVGARSAAMAFNRLADRKIDGANPRTSGRHLPAGILTVKTVSAFTIFSSAVFVAGTLLFLPNWIPLAASPVVLAFLFGYSYAKRFTSLAHFWLGGALMLAPICAWLAIRGLIVIEFPLDVLPALLLGIAVLSWVAGFDIIYACQDYEFDRGAKLKSIPASLGVTGALRMAAICHLVMIVSLAILPFTSNLGGPAVNLGLLYWIGIVTIAGLLVWEHVLVRPDDLTRLNMAFFNINAIVSLGLFLVGTVDLLLG